MAPGLGLIWYILSALMAGLVHFVIIWKGRSEVSLGRTYTEMENINSIEEKLSSERGPTCKRNTETPKQERTELPTENMPRAGFATTPTRSSGQSCLTAH